MKKQLLFISLLFISSMKSQINTRTGGAINVLPNNPTTNTNVGIGTNTPSEKLDVNGNIQGKMGIFTNSLPNGTIFSNWAEQTDKSLVLSAGSLLGSGPGYLRSRMLSFYDMPSSNIISKPVLYLSIEDRMDFKRFLMTAETGGYTQMQVLNKSQEKLFEIWEDGSDNVKLMLPKQNSFLGIGTTSFNDGTDTYRLSVAGNIRAHRVKVYTTWADFVFEKNYVLPSLEEVEQHIIEKGHLKDIPSAEAVEKNGIELGEMNKLLLQKIEELTLYIIKQNKEIVEIKKQIKK
jgi:hypothetical protein